MRTRPGVVDCWGTITNTRRIPPNRAAATTRVPARRSDHVSHSPDHVHIDGVVCNIDGATLNASKPLEAAGRHSDFAVEIRRSGIGYSAGIQPGVTAHELRAGRTGTGAGQRCRSDEHLYRG